MGKEELEKQYVERLFKEGKRAEALAVYRASSNAVKPNISQEDFDAYYHRKIRGRISDRAWLIINGPLGGPISWLGLITGMLIILSHIPIVVGLIIGSSLACSTYAFIIICQCYKYLKANKEQFVHLIIFIVSQVVLIGYLSWILSAYINERGSLVTTASSILMVFLFALIVPKFRRFGMNAIALLVNSETDERRNR